MSTTPPAAPSPLELTIDDVILQVRAATAQFELVEYDHVMWQTALRRQVPKLDYDANYFATIDKICATTSATVNTFLGAWKASGRVETDDKIAQLWDAIDLCDAGLSVINRRLDVVWPQK